MIIDRRLSRRAVLGTALAGAIGGAAAACGGSGPTSAGGQAPATNTGGSAAGSGAAPSAVGGANSSPAGGKSGASSLLPTYAPYTGVKPSGPSTSDLVVPAFDSYPTDPAPFAQKPPLSGGTVNVFTNTNVGTPPPIGKNPFWQALNKQAGATINYTMVPNADYLPKLQTGLAGGTLGDIVSMRNIANMPELLKREFTDLSPWLSGDNVKKYPGLANIPTISWRASVYAGGLYTIPIPRMPAYGQMTIRVDAIEKAGADPNITSYADFAKVCKAVTDPGRHTWALENPPWLLYFVREMTGNQFLWREEDGKFTYYGEEDTFTQALSAVASLWKQGLFHPDSFSSPGSAESWLEGGIVNMANGSEDWELDWQGPAGSKWQLIVAPKYDGGGPGSQYYYTAQYGSGIALKKASESRIGELLEFMNWLAAPFGTQEYRFFQQGVEGVDYTIKDGVLTRTEQGNSDLNLPVRYTGAPAYALFAEGHADTIKRAYDFQIAAAKVPSLEPTVGLYSTTDSTTGAILAKTLTDLTNSIIQGRKSIKDWTSAMKTWRSQGGDTIRSEYEKAYAANH